MPDISVYDSSAVSDRAATTILNDFEIWIVEFVLPLDVRSIPELTRTISKYETVSAAESVSLEGPGFEFHMEDSVFGWPRMPVREISAAFAPAFNTLSTLKTPAYSGTGSFGWKLSNRSPAYRGTATLAPDSYSLSLSGRQPSRTLEATFGGFLTGKMPTRELDISLDAGISLSLSKSLPGWYGSAELSAPRTFSLNASSPIWTLGILLGSSGDILTLDSYIPGAFLLFAEMSIFDTFLVAGKIPTRRLSSSIYCNSITLEANMPVWIMQEVLDGVIIESNLYDDYILRYVRP